MKSRIRAEKPRESPLSSRMKEIEGEEAITSDYQSYLKDESNLSGGKARYLAFPESEADISQFLKKMNDLRIPVTFSGGRTGVTGGAMPFGGAVLSLEKMDRILDFGKDEKTGEWYIRAQPGILLEKFHERVEKKDIRELLSSPSVATRKAVEEFLGLKETFFYPVDPTEASASLGGTIATNASGERSFRYGPTRNYVRAIRIVLANGDVLNLRRGLAKPSPGQDFEVVLTNGETVSFRLPGYKMPSVKNAAGYYVKEGMDLIDLFIGSEGTLGVISEIEIKIIKKPANILSLVAFFPSEKYAIRFFIRAHEEISGALVFEYFDSQALDILRAKRESDGQGSAIPALPGDARAGIFIELEFREGSMDELYASLEELFQKNHSSTDEAWGGLEPGEREKIRCFRHALPEAVNEIVARNKRSCPAIHKIGTDMAVPGEKLEEMVAYYYDLLKTSGMQYTVFGHIGDNHLHVNILPRTEEELGRAKSIYRDFAKKAVALGGTISAEHGIGKIRHAYLEILYGLEGMKEMAEVKRALDPHCILGRGNIFPESLLEEKQV